MTSRFVASRFARCISLKINFTYESQLSRNSEHPKKAKQRSMTNSIIPLKNAKTSGVGATKKKRCLKREPIFSISIFLVRPSKDSVKIDLVKISNIIQLKIIALHSDIKTNVPFGNDCVVCSLNSVSGKEFTCSNNQIL